MSIKAKNNLFSSKDTIQTPSPNIKHNNSLKTEADTSDNLLTKTCCPNCRYIFHIVTQNKLTSLKQKLDRMTPTRCQEQQQKQQKANPMNYEKPDYHDHEPYKKNQDTPKFQNELKIPDKMTKATKRAQQRPRKEKNEEEKQIKQDIKMMKKYLKAVSKQKKSQIKSHDISIDDEFSPNFNVSQENTSFNKSNIEGFSSIPIQQIELNRKCPHCYAGSVQVEAVVAAAKSKLLEKQLSAMLPFVEDADTTPSYIKCLKQMAVNS